MFGLNILGSLYPIGSGLRELATGFGYKPTGLDKVLLALGYDTPGCIDHISISSPAIQELRQELRRYDLDLLVATGRGYTGAASEKVLRLLAVLEGTSNVTDPPEVTMGNGELRPTHPVFLGASDLTSSI